MAEYGKDKLLKLATDNEKSIKKFIRWRPSITKSYDDLIRDIQLEEITAKLIPEDQWKTHSKKYYGSDAPDNLGGWYDRNTNTIHTTDDEYGREQAMPHELMHYFASHTPGQFGVPDKINPYLELDQKLGGWLPSLHPGGRRPTLKGKLGESPLGKWWNENMATADVAYSDRNNYHPWFDEDAFDTALPTGGHHHHGGGHEEHPGVPHEEQEPPTEEEIPTKNKQGERQMSLSNWWAGNEGWIPDIGGKSTTQTIKDMTGAGPNEGYFPGDQSAVTQFIPGNVIPGLDYNEDEGYIPDAFTGGVPTKQALGVGGIGNFDMDNPESVKALQRRLGVKDDGMFGPKTEAAYRAAVEGERKAADPKADTLRYDYNDQMARERSANSATKLGGWLKNAWYNADKGLGGVLPGGYQSSNVMTAEDYKNRPGQAPK